MSCNGCRVLRKGCSESCILRPCLQWIDSPESQGHATVFVAKFFGRAGLMSFISAVPENQRPALFQSLLFEACGRTVNPVNGAVGLLWTGNWHVCQAAVETVLRGGTLRAMAEAPALALPESDDASEVRDPFGKQRVSKRKGPGSGDEVARSQACDLGLALTPGFPPEKRRPATPSMNSEGSVTTSAESGDRVDGGDRMLLNLFV
ncbi:LOB domain-containing protein 37-like [Magnolia sinica]|uniref:LOB domain-containing protein 37-like n=1 Tax=Magnolia sinica TaxID=86752 RepID=UPI00265B3711|nr:LOB domain-containing protein 37-like [Magnolia sinica]